MALYEFIDLAGLQAFKEESEAKSNSAYATKITIRQNDETGVVTFKLYASDNTLLDTKTLDLDTEHIVKSVALDYEHKKLVFTLNDDSTIEANISDLIDDLDGKISDVADDLADEVSNRQSEITRVEGLIDDEETRAKGVEATKLQKQVVNVLPSQDINTETIYLLVNSSESVNTYRFISYAPDGITKYGEGTVEKTGVVSGDYTQVRVLTNEPTDPNADNFVGRTFYILSNAGVGDDSLNDLYDDTKTAVGIKVQIYNATVNGYTEYMYINNKWEVLGGGSGGADVSGKEDKFNKVSSWGATTSDEKYPSEKLVKDTIDDLENDIETGDLDLISNNDLDTIFPNLESESE